MSCTGTADIGLFATGLWESLGSPTDVSALSISGWVSQPNTLGKLNNLINTCFSGTSEGGVCPDLYNTEFAILGALYSVQFYRKRAAAFAGDGGASPLWHRLKEGDSDITRANPGEMMKVFQGMAKDSMSDLDKLVASYNNFSQGGNVPRSVDFYTINENWAGIDQYYSNTRR